jgi:prephenate dehydrogenase
MINKPDIAIIGAFGNYGRWLTDFFQTRGHAIRKVDKETDLNTAFDMVGEASIVIFSLPINVTPQVIEKFTPYSDESQLWLDVTSLKTGAVNAMLKSKAEVVGLHPMCAPPANGTLNGQTIVVHKARLKKWERWVDNFLQSTKADLKFATPEEHDWYAGVIQEMPHAAIFALAHAYAALGVNIQESMTYTSPFYRIVMSLVGRILKQSSSNPELYLDIQLCNPHSEQFLSQLEDSVRELRRLVQSKDREGLQSFIKIDQEGFGTDVMEQSSAFFSRMIESLTAGK